MKPVENCSNNVGDVFEKISSEQDRVALLYSSGLESSLLLHIAEPWRDRIVVYTVRTGAEFPHMRSFIDRALAGWDHRIVEGDVKTSIRKRGIPANVVPIEHAPAFAATFGQISTPPIVDWVTCCAENRSLPAYRAVLADGLAVAFHGQRAGDYRGERQPPAFEGLRLVAPLWEVSRSEVLEAVRDLGVTIPDHYGEFASSLDCSICPASLTPARRAWMKRHYPTELVTAEALQAVVTGAVVKALSGRGTHHEYEVK